MKTTNLIEAVGTKYFTCNHNAKVTQVISQTDVLDITGAIIYQDVMSTIKGSVDNGRLLVIDRGDPERNAFFEESRRRHELREQYALEYTARFQDLVPFSVAEVGAHIKAFKTEKKYVVDDLRSPKMMAFFFLVQYFRPEVDILVKDASHLFNFIYRNLFPNSYHWDEFYVLTGSTYVVKKAPENYNDFVSDNVVIPTVFGQESLMGKPEWDSCYNRISKVLESNLASKHYRVRDFLDL